MQRSGEIISTTRNPLSYLIRSPQGIIRRNRTAFINTSPGEADTSVTVTPRQSQGATRLAAQMPSTPCSTVQPQQLSPPQCYNHNVPGQQFTRYGRRIVKPVKLDLKQNVEFNCILKREMYYETVDASSSIQGTSLIPTDFGVILTTSLATSTDSVKPLDLYLRES